MKDNVKTWMSKHPVKIDKKEGLRVAKDLMNQEQKRILVVLDKGQYEGVITKEDIRVARLVERRLNQMYHHVLSQAPQAVGNGNGNGNGNGKYKAVPVGAITQKNLGTISEEAPVRDALALMAEKHLSCLPVENRDKQISGVLTAGDVIRYALTELQTKVQLEEQEQQPGDRSSVGGGITEPYRAS